MNVCALTPTGMRPEGMALLGEYINAQTYSGALTWVIVDDCEPATRVPKMRDMFHVKHLRPNWRWRPGLNTQAQSMALGLRDINDATVFVLEDDDIYLPTYIETMLTAIENHELIGERVSRYYNVATCRWRTLKGHHHASMSSTVCRGRALEHMKTVCSRGRKTMLDVTLWKTFAGDKALLSTSNVIGIKGLPGRPGVGVGHRRNFGFADDGRKLHEWAGEYANNYGIFREAA